MPVKCKTCEKIISGNASKEIFNPITGYTEYTCKACDKIFTFKMDCRHKNLEYKDFDTNRSYYECQDCGTTIIGLNAWDYLNGEIDPPRIK